jgi:hypothetical protein
MDAIAPRFNILQRRLHCALEFSLKVHYAKAIIEKLDTVARSVCIGCKYSSLSQRDHSCLTLNQEDKLRGNFEELLRSIDETLILSDWHNSQNYTGRAKIIADVFALKFRRKDYRDTAMKSESWKRSLLKLATVLLKFEERFFLEA